MILISRSGLNRIDRIVPERLNPAQIERSERAYRKPTLNLRDLSQHARVEVYVNS
jgi:hypothetical protein